MEKKRVLFLAAANSTHTVKWVNSLCENYEVHLVYCSNHQPENDRINSNVVLHKLKFKASLGYYTNAFELKKVFNEIKPDIVNVHYASRLWNSCKNS